MKLIKKKAWFFFWPASPNANAQYGEWVSRDETQREKRRFATPLQGEDAAFYALLLRAEDRNPFQSASK